MKRKIYALFVFYLKWEKSNLKDIDSFFYKKMYMFIYKIHSIHADSTIYIPFNEHVHAC